jgi:arsenate reductase-like glutaredoxin family protein
VSQIVTISDVRAAGICASGARRWFEAYGLDFRDFVKNGIDAELLLATGDAYGIRVVEFVRSRNNG